MVPLPYLRRLYQPLSFIHDRRIVVLWNGIMLFNFFIRIAKHPSRADNELSKMNQDTSKGRELAVGADLSGPSPIYRPNANPTTYSGSFLHPHNQPLQLAGQISLLFFIIGSLWIREEKRNRYA